MRDARTFTVSVVLADASRQRVVELRVPVPTSAWEAVSLSGLLESRGDLEHARLGVAVHGRQVERDHPLEAGDRVEILLPLLHDPKLRRRRLAGRSPRGR